MMAGSVKLHPICRVGCQAVPGELGGGGRGGGRLQYQSLHCLRLCIYDGAYSCHQSRRWLLWPGMSACQPQQLLTECKLAMPCQPLDWQVHACSEFNHAGNWCSIGGQGNSTETETPLSDSQSCGCLRLSRASASKADNQPKKEFSCS